ncbi:myelin protein P0-like isoform X2 [Heptranchias perlo]|uniref:myelin protein P0-like isoform X2 n=1 Tax=Heptranchias perlo TaxID=212740 RepID=UPI00355AC13E
MALLFLLSSLIIFYDICSILAVGISSPENLAVGEGEELRLDCTLDYAAYTEIHDIKLDWSYTPHTGAEEKVIFFLYRNLSVVAMNSLFTQRLQWVGDIGHNNGSILITKVKCSDEGNFTCDMRIPRLYSNVFRSSTHLTVLCNDVKSPRFIRLPESVEGVLKNTIIYTMAGIIALFVALSIILVIIWKNCSMHTAPRRQRRNDPGVFENSEETDRYVTVTRRPPLQRDRENKPMEGKKNKESKTDEDNTYVTMETDRYVTVTRRPPLQRDRENKPMEGKKNKDSKTDEVEIYVTMRSFLGTGKSADHPPNPIVLSNPIPGEHSHRV